MKKRKVLIGAHISIEGGLYKAIKRGNEIGCTTIQIFTKSNRSWVAKSLKLENINLFKENQKKSSIEIIVAHTSYLINIGSNKLETEKKSIKALEDELHRCNLLEIPYLVLHPGSHLGAGEETCIEKIARNLDKVLEKNKTKKTKILLETVAGQGTNIGYTFEQLKHIRSQCKEKKQIAVCLDTCHIFSAGYDIGSTKGYEKVIDNFDKVLGLNLLKAIHLNDSKTELGSKKDRHENIGKGKIPAKAFELIMNDKRLINIPKILETPIKKSYHEYTSEIELLKSMVKS